jgi:hypothetical protein
MEWVCNRPVTAPQGYDSRSQAYLNGYTAGKQEAATATREQVLDELARQIEIAEEDEHDDDYWRGISRVSDIIQSLRSTKEQPK